jgi:aspartate kinase
MIETTSRSRNYIYEYKVAVVCSARSGSTKALGTTNLLLRAASEALRQPTKSASRHSSGAATPVSRSMSLFGSCSPPLSPRSRSGSSPRSTSPQPFTTFSQVNEHADTTETVPDFVKTIDLLREEHISAARASVRDPEILRELEAEIERDCDWLRRFLFAAKVGHLVSLSRSVI